MNVHAFNGEDLKLMTNNSFKCYFNNKLNCMYLGNVIYSENFNNYVKTGILDEGSYFMIANIYTEDQGKDNIEFKYLTNLGILINGKFDYCAIYKDKNVGEYSMTYGVKPVIKLSNKNILILGGNGSKDNPYII